LTAAYDLRLAGFPVTVFESAAEPGGMLRYGITAYRLPRDILSEEIDVLLRAGVEIRTGMRLGVDMDLEELHKGEYKSVLLAIGAQNGRPLEIPGARGRPEVKDALALLRRVNAGDQAPVGKRVLVVGGGSTAVEAARTARRLGARTVEILYRRSQEEMPASAEELEAATFEGVRFRYLVAPSQVLTDGDRFLGLECVQVGLGERDSGGRRRPIAIPGTEFRLKADQILTALGQEVDLGFLPSRGRTRFVRDDRLVVDPKTSLTPLARVFAAGDMVSGPSTVIDAIAEGHRAAESIRHLLLDGRPGIWEERPENFAPVEYELPDAPPVVAKRIHPATVAPVPGREFAEVEQRFTRREAIAEARRCLRCGPCGECRTCASTCQRRHIMVRTDDKASRGNTALLRVPAGVSLALEVERPGRGWVLPPSPICCRCARSYGTSAAGAARSAPGPVPSGPSRSSTRPEPTPGRTSNRPCAAGAISARRSARPERPSRARCPPSGGATESAMRWPPSIARRRSRTTSFSPARSGRALWSRSSIGSASTWR
jgi:heterodisulfide reductase subunit A